MATRVLRAPPQPTAGDALALRPLATRPHTEPGADPSGGEVAQWQGEGRGTRGKRKQAEEEEAAAKAAAERTMRAPRSLRA